MTLKTDRGEKEVNWVGGPTSRLGTVIIEADDNRPFSAIAEDYDGLLTMCYTEPYTEKDIVLTGYSRLVQISRMETGSPVQLTLAKEA